MSVMKTAVGAAARLTRGFSYSFITQLTATIKKIKPSLVIVCWEGGKGGREQLHADYKSERTRTPEPIRQQREELKQLLHYLGVEQAMAPGYEADDVIASLANTMPVPIVIYSNDKDFLQLVSDRVHVYQKPRIPGRNARELITPANFEEMTGYRNSKVWRLAQFALGDAVDDIPKVPRVTPKNVHAFFHDMHMGPKTHEFYDDLFYGVGHPDLERNRKLMDLTEVGEIALQITPGKLSAEEAVNFLIEIGFASIVAKFNDWFAVYEGASHSDVSN